MTEQPVPSGDFSAAMALCAPQVYKNPSREVCSLGFPGVAGPGSAFRLPSRKHLPSVPLPPSRYDEWLRENPKEVFGGPLSLQAFSAGGKTGYVPLARAFGSEVLREWANDLILLAEWNEFEELNIWATVQQFDYLLMGHSHHFEGDFTTVDGRSFRDHPHYHEIDYYRLESGKIATRRIVEPPLRPGILPAQFLEAFAQKYKFVSSAGTAAAMSKPPAKSRPTQSPLEKFTKKSKFMGPRR
jgi:hypothetical protein